MVNGELYQIIRNCRFYCTGMPGDTHKIRDTTINVKHTLLLLAYPCHIYQWFFLPPLSLINFLCRIIFSLLPTGPVHLDCPEPSFLHTKNSLWPIKILMTYSWGNLFPVASDCSQFRQFFS